MYADIIPQISSKYFKAKCICANSKHCGKISRSFQNFNDLRGSFIQFPMINGCQRFHIQNAIKTKRAERFFFYLNTPYPFKPKEENKSVALVTDNRNLKNDTQEDTSNSGVIGKDVKKRRAFIALHHFHPRLIDPKYGIAKACCNKTRFILPDTMPIEKLQCWGLMEFYTSNDIYDQRKSLIVPNYPRSKVEDDLSCITISFIQKDVPNNLLAIPEQLREGEVMTQKKGVKRSKPNESEEIGIQAGMKLKKTSSILCDIHGSLRRIHSRASAMDTFCSKVFQADHEISANDLASINNLVVGSSFEVQFIISLQKKLADVHMASMQNAVLLSNCNNNTFESVQDALATQSFSDALSIDSLNGQLSYLERILFVR